MLILFIRHAEAKNDKLTSFGLKQCELLSNQTEDYEFFKIYSSPAYRCKKTAEYYNENKHLKLEIDERLNERETLENSPQNEFEKLWYDNYMNPKFSSKQPEGCKELLDRVYDFLDEKISFHKQKNENFVVVSHSGIFYAFMSYFNREKTGDINWYKIGNASKVYFEIKNK